MRIKKILPFLLLAIVLFGIVYNWGKDTDTGDAGDVEAYMERGE